MSTDRIQHPRLSTQEPHALKEITSSEWKRLDEAISSNDRFASFYLCSPRPIIPRSEQVELCKALAQLTANDPDRIDALFRQSAIFTPEWDQRLDSGQTNGQSIIAEALQTNSPHTLFSPAEIVDGLIAEGEICVLFGYYGIGKTPVVQQLAFCVTNGIPWLDRKTLPRTVIVIDFETPPSRYRANCARFSQRWPHATILPDAVLSLAREDGAGIRVLQPLKRMWASRFDFLQQQLRKSPNALVIIDPAEQFFYFNRNYSLQVLDLFSRIRGLLRSFPGASIPLVMNLRRRGRRSPVLLTHPRNWLEETAGNLDLLNRTDVRLAARGETRL